MTGSHRGDEAFLWIAGLAGIGGFVYEVAIDKGDRPWILAACTTFVGLRFTVRLDPRGRRIARAAGALLTSLTSDENGGQDEQPPTR